MACSASVATWVGAAVAVLNTSVGVAFVPQAARPGTNNKATNMAVRCAAMRVIIYQMFTKSLSVAAGWCCLQQVAIIRLI